MEGMEVVRIQTLNEFFNIDGPEFMKLDYHVDDEHPAPWNVGIPHSEETKQLIREKCSGENNPNFGKSLSEEVKQKISEAKKGKPRDEETKAKISATLTKLTPEERRANYNNYQREYMRKKRAADKLKSFANVELL